MQKSDGRSSARAYEGLRDDVVSGFYVPGQAISELEAAERYEVSRTPVREAMRLLAAEGLLTLVPRRGVFVREITARDVHEVFELREALESWAIEAAGHRIDRDALRSLAYQYDRVSEEGGVQPEVFQYSAETELHHLIIEATGNRRLAEVLRTQTLQTARLRALYWRQSDSRIDDHIDERLRAAGREHRELIGRLLEEDYAGARELLVEHLRRGREDLLHLLATVDLAAAGSGAGSVVADEPGVAR